MADDKVRAYVSILSTGFLSAKYHLFTSPARRFFAIIEHVIITI